MLAAAVTLAALSTVQPASALIAANGHNLNGSNLNGLSLNGLTMNGQSFGTNPLAGSVDQVTSIVLPSGEIIR
jgi:hypothetical protein